MSMQMPKKHSESNQHRGSNPRNDVDDSFSHPDKARSIKESDYREAAKDLSMNEGGEAEVRATSSQESSLKSSQSDYPVSQQTVSEDKGCCNPSFKEEQSSSQESSSCCQLGNEKTSKEDSEKQQSRGGVFERFGKYIDREVQNFPQGNNTQDSSKGLQTFQKLGGFIDREIQKVKADPDMKAASGHDNTFERIGKAIDSELIESISGKKQISDEEIQDFASQAKLMFTQVFIKEDHKGGLLHQAKEAITSMIPGKKDTSNK